MLTTRRKWLLLALVPLFSIFFLGANIGVLEFGLWLLALAVWVWAFAVWGRHHRAAATSTG